MSASRVFEMLLPPDWVRIAADERGDAALAVLVERAVASAPTGRGAEVRTLVSGAFASSLRAAREQGATDVVLSLAQVAGAPVPASIVVTRRPVVGGDTLSPTERVLAIAAREQGTVVELGGRAAVRRVRTYAAEGDTPARRAISFLCQLPGGAEWIMFTATMLWGDDPELEEPLSALEFLIDAVMTTVRFVPVEGAA